MPAIKLTLQNRITTLMVISSIILVSAFTTIQLSSKLNDLTQHNSYMANLSTVIVKNNMENILKQLDTQDMPEYMHKSLLRLKETNIIKDAVIFDREGKIISSSDINGPAVNSVNFRDVGKLLDLESLEKEGKWFVSEIDSANRRLDMFISLKKNGSEPITYIAKISFSLGNLSEALAAVYRPVIFAIIIIILANILIGYLLSRMVIGPIRILNQVTKIIAEGDLNIRTNINTNDELQDLGDTFNYMTEQLVKMKERAENANPLTKLPGNIVIHDEIDKRIRNNSKFVVVYCDLDNFKAFNDKYGIAKGDEAIKLTSEIFKEAASTKGNIDDFLGHEGGDDFILVTTPEKSEDITNYIIKEFDQRIRTLYNSEDLAQGFIVAHARDGSVKNFPIMTISLAGVTNTHREIKSYGEVTNIAAEVKKKAKSIETSVFVMDKRHS